MNGFPATLATFCEKLAVAVTTTGNQNGWRVQQFGRRGFNADVTAGGELAVAGRGAAPV